MILIGQYDSPFVRRVGVALTLYEIPFAHQPWSVFGDAEKIRPHNPLTRVPTLLLDDGEALVETFAILDHLDSLVPESSRLIAASGPERRHAFRISALATGLADKSVSLFYELRLHRETSDVWIARCRAQIFATLALLERERAAMTGDFWFGRMGHADIAVAATLRFVGEAHAGLVTMADYPALSAHAERMEALPAFRAIQQPFIAPA